MAIPLAPGTADCISVTDDRNICCGPSGFAFLYTVGVAYIFISIIVVSISVLLPLYFMGCTYNLMQCGVVEGSG